MGRQKDRFTGKMFIRLWIPAMISALGWALSDMADAIVVGQRMGATGLAAIALILPVYMINCMFAHGFGIGGSVCYSKLLGEGKPDEAVKSFNIVIQASLAVSILTAVLGNIFMTQLLAVLGTTAKDGPLFEATLAYLRIQITATPLFYMSNILNYYLRNDENQKLASVGSAVGNVVDILMNVTLVIFVGLGTAGAAMSTVIGQVIAIVIYLPGVFGKSHYIKIKKVNPSVKEAFSTFRAGFASSVTYLFQLVFLLVSNNVLMRVSGENGVAVFDMVQNASYLIMYLYEGTSRAMQPLVSTYNGEHNAEGERRTAKLGIVYGSGAGLFMIAFVCIFPGVICSLFGLTGSESQALGYMALRIYSLGAAFGGISVLIGSYYQSLELEKEAFLLATLRGAAVLLPATMVFAALGLELFWWLFPVTEILTLGIYCLRLKFGKTMKTDYNRDRVFNRTIEGKSQDVSDLTGEAEEFCERWGATMKQTYFVTMTVEEICLAIMKEGFSSMKDGFIQLTLVSCEDGQFELHIRDNATSFNPFSLDTNKASQDGDFNMDAMGMLVIKNKAKEFFYRRYQGFNSLVVKV